MNRRHAMYAGMAALLLLPRPSGADSATDKKQRALAAKAAAVPIDSSQVARYHRQLDRRVGKPPPPVVDVENGWTHEHLAVAADAPPVPQEVVDRFLRCHYTNRAARMDPRLFRAVLGAARHFGAPRALVISGHRSAKYNLVLRKKGREVSPDSKHVLGVALDFRLPGVATAALRAWAQAQRLGGVGYYPESGFIHIDTARVRTWTGR